ncbi:hypothetical protein ACFQXB_09245 [Plastorhodobacter daqingensis]|uniref:Uncharacterized protein n=1 Tax=Plastorhodobacter daqingensis TaxID=1387281 RepID=A0ABW2UI47_9RHOB
MFLELIATIASGFAAAGVVLILNKAMRGRLPRWFMPAAAGLAMFSYVVWSEYSWLPRMTESFPDGVEVVSVNYETSFYRPWTYLSPLANRLVAVDTRMNRRNEALPDLVLTRLVLRARWEPGADVPVIFDCAGSRRAALTDAVAFAADGAPVGADWVTLPPDDPALARACAEGGERGV